VIRTLCAVLLLLLCACGTTTIRYRLTLQVEVDGVVHTGSGVIDTEWTHFPKWMQGFGSVWAVEARGDAIVVDLGSRGLLFALLTGPARYDQGHPLRVDPTDPQAILGNFRFIGREGITPESLDRLDLRQDVIDVPFSRLPALVRFGDIRNPGSWEQVNPADLAARFGPGVRLIGATLAITHAPISRGIDARLPWFNDLKKHEREYRDGGPLAPLGTMAFHR
jgi:hypothetical protein